MTAYERVLQEYSAALHELEGRSLPIPEYGLELNAITKKYQALLAQAYRNQFN